MVEVTTYLPINGEKVTVGKLTDYTEDAIILEDITIPRDKAASVRLHLEF
jgi:ribosome maturation factor RimP